MLVYCMLSYFFKPHPLPRLSSCVHDSKNYNIIAFLFFYDYAVQLRGDRVGSTVALQQNGLGSIPGLGFSLHGVCIFPLVTLASSHFPKTCLLG